MAMWDDVKRNLLSWYDTASDRTGEVARIGLKRYDIFGISRDIERQFSEIGSLVYSAIKEGRDDILQDGALLSLIERVKVLEADLAAKEGEIDALRTAKATAREAKRQATPPPQDEPPLDAWAIEPDPEPDEDTDEPDTPRSGD